MQTWMKYVLGLVVPAFAFLVLKDTAGQYYSVNGAKSLSYVVAEEVEDPAPAPQEPEAIADVAETEELAEVAPLAQEPEIADQAAPVEDVTIAAETEAAAPDGMSADLLAAGAQAARACAACHQFERERNGAGPHLVGVIGRPVGSADGFRYSSALKDMGDQGAVWSVEEIEAWLEDPRAYAPGTKMNFKVGDADERRLIANWLAAQGE